MAKAAERAHDMNERHKGNSPIPCCGHDWWEQMKTAEFGDVIMCNMCHVYYAKIKHLPWIVEEKGYGESWNPKPKGYHTHHLNGAWFVPIPARVTD